MREYFKRIYCPETNATLAAKSSICFLISLACSFVLARGFLSTNKAIFLTASA